MSFLSRLADWLRIPGSPTSAEDVGISERIEFHEDSLRHNPHFKQLAIDMQVTTLKIIESFTSRCTSLRILEIGAGAIPLNQVSSDALSSDLVFSRSIDICLSAYQAPFKRNSFRAVVGQNVFHHLNDYKAALRELSKIVEPSGVIILIEPYFGWLARTIFPALFSIEDFEMEGTRDTSDLSATPNQALSYIVFKRDIESFSIDFPGLELVETLPLRSGLRYLSVGGLNFKRLLPGKAINAIRGLEHSKFGYLLERYFAMHWVIVLKKRSEIDE